VLPDGTHLHDQQIMTPGGPRWLAWRDVVVWAEERAPKYRASAADVTDRMEPNARSRSTRNGRRSRKRRQVALSRHGVDEIPHAAERILAWPSFCATRR